MRKCFDGRNAESHGAPAHRSPIVAGGDGRPLHLQARSLRFSCGEDGAGIDAGDASFGKSGVGGFDGTGKSDGAGGIFDDQGFKAELLAVDGGEADAEVIGQAAEEEAL